MATNYSPKIVTDGLVIYLDAADKNTYSSGSTTWSDLSGNGYDGVLSRGTIGTVSGSENVMSFNGDDEYITISNRPTRAEDDPATQECWCQIHEMTWTGLVSEHSYTTGFTVYPNGTSGGFHIYIDEDASAELNTSGNYVTGSDGRSDWMHMCCTFGDGANTLKLYVDGQLVGTSTSITARVPATTTTHLGADTALNYYLKGSMATYRHYHKALSAKEVLENFNAQRSRFGV